MSRKDIFHDLVKDALAQDGWIISHDPLYSTLRNGLVQKFRTKLLHQAGN